MVRRGSFISPDFYVKNKLDLYLNLPAFLAAVEFAAAFVAVVGSVDFVNVGCFVVVEWLVVGGFVVEGFVVAAEKHSGYYYYY